MRTSMISVLLLLALQASPVRAQQAAATPVLEVSQLIGSWEGTDATGEKGTLQFQPGGFAQMTMNGQPLVPMIPKGPTLRFEINAAKSPMWMDLVARDSSGKELGRFKFIFRMVGPKEMVIRCGEEPGIRPTAFDDSDKENTLTLTKVY